MLYCERENKTFTCKNIKIDFKYQIKRKVKNISSAGSYFINKIVNVHKCYNYNITTLYVVYNL